MVLKLFDECSASFGRSVDDLWKQAFRDNGGSVLPPKSRDRADYWITNDADDKDAIEFCRSNRDALFSSWISDSIRRRALQEPLNYIFMEPSVSKHVHPRDSRTAPISETGIGVPAMGKRHVGSRLTDYDPEMEEEWMRQHFGADADRFFPLRNVQTQDSALPLPSTQATGMPRQRKPSRKLQTQDNALPFSSTQAAGEPWQRKPSSNAETQDNALPLPSREAAGEPLQRKPFSNAETQDSLLPRPSTQPVGEPRQRKRSRSVQTQDSILPPPSTQVSSEPQRKQKPKPVTNWGISENGSGLESGVPVETIRLDASMDLSEVAPSIDFAPMDLDDVVVDLSESIAEEIPAPPVERPRKSQTTRVEKEMPKSQKAASKATTKTASKPAAKPSAKGKERTEPRVLSPAPTVAQRQQSQARRGLVYTLADFPELDDPDFGSEIRVFEANINGDRVVIKNTDVLPQQQRSAKNKKQKR